LRAHGDEAKILAGGQSLLPALNMRLLRPGVLVDLTLQQVSTPFTEDDGSLRVGAPRPAGRRPAVEARTHWLSAAGGVPAARRSRRDRNRGTVCGSVAHADAAAELPLALVATRRRGSSPHAERFPASEFFVTHFTTVLEPDELVIATTWPASDRVKAARSKNSLSATADFALASTACVLHIEEGKVTDARLAVGSVTGPPRPRRREPAGRASGRREVARSIAVAVAASIDPPPNLHGSPGYRRHLIEVLVQRAVGRAWAAAS